MFLMVTRGGIVRCRTAPGWWLKESSSIQLSCCFVVAAEQSTSQAMRTAQLRVSELHGFLALGVFPSELFRFGMISRRAAAWTLLSRGVTGGRRCCTCGEINRSVLLVLHTCAKYFLVY